MHSRRVCIKSSLSVSVFGFSESVFNSFVNPFMSNVAYVCCLAGLLRHLSLSRHFIIIASLHPGVEMSTVESWGVTSDGVSCSGGIEIFSVI